LHSLLSMKKHYLILLGLSLIFTPYSVYAVRVPGLYESEVPVQDQGAASRRQAVEQAMKQVLVKLTGDRNAATRVALSPVIDTAENYVQQYRYLQVAEGENLAAGSKLRISIQFDDANLDNALRNLGIQVWGRERPSTLIWIAMEDEVSRRILQPAEDPDIFHKIDQRARARGIVMINPLFDLQDNSNLRASDIWGGFHFTVKSASKRYYPDLILTGKISSPLPGIWEALWTGYLDEKERTFSTEGSYLESVLNEGIDGIADLIAVNFARGTMAEIGDAILRVIDVISLQQYAKVLNYLQSLSPVTDVEVIRLSTGNVVFKISAHGGEAAITQAINFGRILESVSENQNIYRLLP
jgi:uncharacterized protein